MSHGELAHPYGLDNANYCEDDGHRVITEGLTLFKGPDEHSGVIQLIFVSPEDAFVSLKPSVKINTTITYGSMYTPTKHRELTKVITKVLEKC